MNFVLHIPHWLQSKVSRQRAHSGSMALSRNPCSHEAKPLCPMRGLTDAVTVRLTVRTPGVPMHEATLTSLCDHQEVGHILQGVALLMSMEAAVL